MLIKKSPDEQEWVAKIAHALKGLAGNLYIKQVAMVAGELDAKLKQGDMEACDSLIGELNDALVGFAKLPCRLVLPEGSPSIKKEMNLVVVKELLSKIDQGLDDLNPDTVEPLIKELSCYLDSNDISRLQAYIDSFDFELAKKVVADLEATLN